jgi:hypothetical protein
MTYRVAARPTGGRRFSIQGTQISIGPRRGSRPRPLVAAVADQDAEAGGSARVATPIAASPPSGGRGSGCVHTLIRPAQGLHDLDAIVTTIGRNGPSRALPRAPIDLPASLPSGRRSGPRHCRASDRQAGDIVHWRFARRRPCPHVRGLPPRWKSAGSNVEQSRNRSDP